jgi:hypothetical protein
MNRKVYQDRLGTKAKETQQNYYSSHHVQRVDDLGEAVGTARLQRLGTFLR